MLACLHACVHAWVAWLAADAYGEAGNAALGVPGGATLEVDVRLMGWAKVEEVTDDALVVKKTLSGDSEE